jgi:hypothetical protein
MKNNIKERITEIGEGISETSNNFNGNHKRTIRDLKKRKKDIEELIQNLEEERKEQKIQTNLKRAFSIFLVILVLGLVVANINYKINKEAKFSVTENFSTFTGEVRNIDDINGISRFSEVNLNNESFSIAAFSATNNVGDIMWMGISGSNFDVGSLDNQSRTGALFLDSPSNMNNMIGYDQGFIWKNNKFNDALIVNTTNLLMNLTNDGNLEINGSFIGGTAGIKFRVKGGKDLFSLFPFHMGMGGAGNIPDAFDDALILQTDDISNQYKMEFCWWDAENEVMTFCSNEGYPNRATTFRRSLQIVGNTSVKENDLNFTLCEGYSYIDCNTNTTGADLGIQDDIESLGSIFTNENFTSKNLNGTGDAFVCTNENGTLFRKSSACV